VEAGQAKFVEAKQKQCKQNKNKLNSLSALIHKNRRNAASSSEKAILL